MPFPQFKKVSNHQPYNDDNLMVKKTKKKKKLIKILLRYGVMAGAVLLILIVALFAWFSRGLPNPDRIIDRTIAQSTKIYDSKQETVLYEIHGDEKRTLVKLDEMPDYIPKATIAVEDRYFYDHHGFNVVAMIKGTLIDPLLGRGVRGGSTLTQQLVKNAILTNERSISRKIKEFILSFQIESKFTKDQILQMYLNEIPYGSTAYGVASAAQTYFGKELKDITLGEAAVLAALPQAPTFYSPYGNNVDRLIVRQQYVLDQMTDLGYITKQQADEARSEQIVFRKKSESIQAPHFVMYVKEKLADMFGDKMVEQGGLKVITTLDVEMQKKAEEAVVNGVDRRGGQYGFTNAALFAMNPKDGHILAMVGSKDYFDDTIDGNVNVTTRLRQPGSSIKPLVYAAAFNKGYTPETMLFDVNTIFKTDTKNYEPKNYDLKENGPVTMRKALQGSLNIPAVKTLYLVGIDNMINFLEMMGYTSFQDRSRFGLALVLGGGEVTLEEHVAAFSVFPNEGIYRESVAILKVEDANGEVLFEAKEKERKVLDKNIANTMNNVLSDNGARAYIFGANNYLTISGRPVGAKTGTTNDYRDAWTVGYTPSIAAGVWVGNNNNSEMKRGADGSVIAAPIWNEFMSAVLQGQPVESFNSFIPAKTDKPVLNGNFANEQILKIDKFSGKLATDNTPASAVEEKTFKEVHNILHYVNKDDPQGGYPNTPQSDQQYSSWESGVQKWIEKQKTSDDPAKREQFDFINQAPPTEYDDVHIPANKPSLQIYSPQNNETISSSNLNVEVNVSAPRGISRVEYYLDEQLINTVYSAPFNLSFNISSIFGNGYHKLKVVVFDDVDNSAEEAIDINVLAERKDPSVNWINPIGNRSLSAGDFPFVTTVQLNDVLASKKIDFYYNKNGSSATSLYGSEVAPGNQNISVPMEYPGEAGVYELRAILTLQDNRTFSSGVVKVKVD
ncbi:hypothetical protein A2533_02550 [Candidatus Falkowbacteria bacterium RIFOXYD2_FULL_35_9]|uniref:Uncharacterized protein n=1 Tax=Candidatus Falkowbacteria bacterium RIFOXYC2_FULL_36_12 TaxID=1798002 RepID=A0A1F5T421_9BACT|nr:MAG: hypothetical protein A2478_02160 [Candidatus Falkowbacteria bacterium RIFOXYC2_FULL_36_12]OGF34120.1 MAG: hypothetical protein A2223_01670 [Candidatus Falkowbacteria bacterium RIFOXYA2_FULL_35_8]OGF46856.1 MAG: hypothetical protein A2533_02550 [Candidatus Falkowbacteria bacterium RIFOXYD2_FULL_35_9]